MERKTINNLPDELLLHVFELLDAETLKVCCLTTLRWNNIISHSSKTMEKFQLKLVGLDWPLKKNLLSLQRKILTINIEKQTSQEETVKLSLELSQAFHQLLEKYGAHLRHFKASESDFMNFDQSLKLMPRLESLELNKVVLFGKETQQYDLPQLKHFAIIDCEIEDDEVLRLLKSAPNVTSLEISGSQNRPNLLKYVLNLKPLERLSVSNLPSFLSSEDIKHVPFRLKHLSIRNKPLCTDANNPEYVRQFFKLQEESLQHFTLRQVLHGDCSEQIFDFKNLISLDIYATCLPEDQTIYACLPQMPNVKSLTIRSCFKSRNVTLAFFKIFPSLVKLDIQELQTRAWNSRFLGTIAKEQKELQHLRISNLFAGTRATLLFENLTTFEVTSIQNVKLWIDFILNHRKLHKITAAVSTGKLTTDVLEKLLDHPTLRHIKLSGPSEALSKVFDVIKDDYKKLTSIEFEVTHPKEVKFTVNFPMERGSWKPEQYAQRLKL